jgi:hypothetical protein
MYMVKNRFLSGWLFGDFFTAFARITELGIGMYPEVLIRASHFLVPICLILINSEKTVEVKVP